MSTLQVANIWFDSTSNNRIQYAGSNSYVLIAGNANTLTVNTTGVSISGTSAHTGAATFSNTTAYTGAATFSNTVTFSSDIVPATSYKRNRIINGDMRIDQRNAGASVSVGTATATYTLDRWRVYHDTAITSNITAQQSTTVPTIGYINSQILTNGTAATAAAGDANIIQQRVEGLNVADLNFGSSTAATVTLSFWVRSSLTGTFGITLANSAQNRSYVSTYTISVANTWEQKTVTVAGDQSGTWLTTSGIGLIASWDLGSGTSLNTTAGAWQAGQYFRTSACTSFIGTTAATFYITGVQLEVGTKATPYEMQIYSDQLAQCQRYYQKTYNQGTVPGTSYTAGSASQLFGSTASNANQKGASSFKVSMRTSPTLTLYDQTGLAGYICYFNGTTYAGGGGFATTAYDSGFSIGSSGNCYIVNYEYTASSEL